MLGVEIVEISENRGSKREIESRELEQEAKDSGWSYYSDSLTND